MKTPQYRSIEGQLERLGVSGKIARGGIEGGRETDAMLEGGVIKDTWGGYASRLIEYWGEKGVDLDTKTVLELLGIDIEDTKNPKTHFTRSTGLTFSDYESIRRSKFRDEAKATYTEHEKELETTLDMIRDSFAITDTSEAQAIQGEIEAVVHGEEYIALLTQIRHLSGLSEDYYHNSIMSPDEKERQDAIEKRAKVQRELNQLHDKKEAIDDSLKILCVRRDAVASGICAPLDVVITALMSADIHSNPLAHIWFTRIRDALSNFEDEYELDRVHTQVTDIVVGRKFFSSLRHFEPSKNIRRAVEEKWAIIRPAFVTNSQLHTHPLVTGIGEK